MRNHKSRYLLQRLFEFGDGELFCGRDAVEGVSIMGGNGSGKSSGSGAAIASTLLRAGYGGLVLTSKPDDLAMLARVYFAGTGRDPRADLVVLQPEGSPPGSIWPDDLLGESAAYRVNLLRYEYERGGGLTANVVDLLYAGTTGSTQYSARDPFWDEALRELLVHAVDLSVIGSQLGTGEAEVRLDDILEIIITAPTSIEAVGSSRFQEGRCGRLIRMADDGRQKLSDARFRDLQLSVQYWLQQFPTMAEETRSSIVGTFTAKVSGLLRSPLREMFCSETDPEVDPDVTLNARTPDGHPKVLVVNLPVKLYQGVGRFAQCLMKTLWQHAAERRTAEIEGEAPLWRPAFLLADEAQYFITPQDMGFQQTARSTMVATVYLTQNLPNYYAAVGENATHSFLGTLQTKVFHANGDPTTNEWAERLFGDAVTGFRCDALTGEAESSLSHSMSPLIPAVRFTELLKGGLSGDPGRQGVVGSYVFQAGRQWSCARADRHYHEFIQPGHIDRRV